MRFLLLFALVAMTGIANAQCAGCPPKIIKVGGEGDVSTLTVASDGTATHTAGGVTTAFKTGESAWNNADGTAATQGSTDINYNNGLVSIGTTKNKDALTVKGVINSSFLTEPNQGSGGETLGSYTFGGFDRTTPVGEISVVSQNGWDDNGDMVFGLSAGGGGNLSEKARISHLGDFSTKRGVVVGDGSGLADLIIQNGTGFSTFGWVTTSDERVKTNITNTKSNIDLIKSIRVVDYDYVTGLKNQTGFIAQELMTTLPSVVYGTEETTFGVDYSKIVPHLVKAIQEQQTQIDLLQKQVQKLSK